MVIKVVVSRIRKTRNISNNFPLGTKAIGTASSIGSSRLGDDIAFYSRTSVTTGTEGILGDFIDIGSGTMSKKAHGHSKIFEFIPNK